jgi:iron complex outermembrane recepter protein
VRLLRKLLLLGLIGSSVAPPASGADPAVTLAADIGPRPVAEALAAFGRQTGLQLIYVSTIAEAQQSKGARAGLTASEALTQLLEGTGLRFEFLNARTVRIFPAPTVVPTAVASLPAAPHSAQGRAAAGAYAVNQLEEVVITGSHLKRAEAQTAEPLLIFTRDALSSSGVQTAQELLTHVSAIQSFGGSNESTGLGGLHGFTAASLRGLGSQRTLVLLDGQRLAPYALSGGQGVDLSGIPSSALERLEILKDGASAIYGTDAIGGVINYVLRTDYQGAELNVDQFATEHGGGNNGRVSATAGAGDLTRDQYNVFLSADYFKQQPLKASQRDSTTTSYIPWLGVDYTSRNSSPANITQPGGFGSDARNPTIPFPAGVTAGSCPEPLAFPTANFPFACRFDAAHLIDTIPEVAKASVIARFTGQLSARQQFFAEASYYEGTFIQRLAPTPVGSDFTNTPMTLPPTSAFYPGAYVASLANGDITLPLELHYRTVELGPRVDRLTAQLWRGVLGLQGQFSGWDYELTAEYTANREVDRFVSGWLSESRFGPLLRSGVIDPFGFNTDAVVQQMRAAEFMGWVSDDHAADYGGAYRMTRAIWQAPGGPVALAFGLEGRRESLEQLSSAAFASRDIIGESTAVPPLPQASRTVEVLYGETDIPITRMIETDLALRYDHYSDFGSATNPKVSLRWRPAEMLALRAVYGRGFRVPTLSDLFLPPMQGFTINSFDDPLRCSVTHSPNDCGVSFRSLSGGNRVLTPETSRQWGAGIVLGPAQGLSASIDYFRVQVGDVIDTLQADEIFANYALWAPAHVVRKPPDSQYPGLPGEIDHVIENQVNFGSIRTAGVDADFKFAGPATPVGRFTVGLSGTYTLDYSRAGINTSLFPAGVGTRGPEGAISRWRHNLTLDWSYRQWGVTLVQTFQDGYREVDLLSCDQNFNCPGTRRVGAYSLWDLQGRYQGIKNVTASLGIRNLLDASPPVSNQAQDLQVGIDPTYADSRGRTYYIAIRYAIK